MRIFASDLKTFADTVRIQANVEYNDAVNLLWFDFDKKYADFITHDCYDGFVVSLLSLAMKKNEPIYVEGAISELLCNNLKLYMSSISPFFPGFKNVEIEAYRFNKKVHSLKYGTGASFMLNIDSLNMIQRHFNSIEYLVYANFGFFYAGGKAGRVEEITAGSFNQRVEKMVEANEKYLHKELVIVDSNIETFIEEPVDIEISFGTMTMGIVLLLQGLLAAYLMPSTVYYNNIGARNHIIPLPFRLLLTESLQLIHDLPKFEYERVGERGNPAETEDKQILNVCGIADPDEKNCTACSECISSLIDNGMTDYKEKFFNIFVLSNPGKEDHINVEVTSGKQESVAVICENVDVSVVLPFYKKYHDFVKVLPLNTKYFSRPGVEVVIAMDESTEEEKVLDYIKGYPQISWVVIVNDTYHEWRSPVKALNVGIKHASRRYILVMSPESQMATDIISQFSMGIKGGKNYCIGQVHFLDYSGTRFFASGLPYGSLMVSRDNLIKIGGYDENICEWGGDDDNVRIRLKMIGVKETFLADAHVLHREDKIIARKSQSLEQLAHEKILQPEHWLANDGCFGHDFNRIAYHYARVDNSRG